MSGAQNQKWQHSSTCSTTPWYTSTHKCMLCKIAERSLPKSLRKGRNIKASKENSQAFHS